MPQPRVDRAEGENRITTWFSSKNQIGPFRPLTYMHRSTYKIMSPEFGYNLYACSKTCIRILKYAYAFLAQKQ